MAGYLNEHIAEIMLKPVMDLITRLLYEQEVGEDPEETLP